MNQATALSGPGRAAEPLWQRPWLNSYPVGVPSSLAYPNVPVSSLLENAARRFPDRVACTLFGQSTTHVKLAEQCRRFATALADLGAGPGRRVGMLLPNSPEYIVALHGAWLTGATALQLSPLMVAEELAKWIEMTDCHVVVTLDLLAPTIMNLVGRGPLKHIIITSMAERLEPWKGWLYRVERVRRHGPVRLREGEHVHRFDTLVRARARALTPRIAPAEDVAVLAPTGGTTSSPKAVMLTHRNLIANALQLRAWSKGEDGTECGVAVLPFFHAYGLSVGLLASLAGAGTLHLLPRFDPAAVLTLLTKYRANLMAAVPALLVALNALLKEKPRDLSFLRAVMSGASALTKEVRTEFEGHGAKHVVEGYGLSEASPVTHANPLDAGNRSGTIGLPLPDTEAKIMDQDAGTVELADGVAGELVIRGPQVMKGYFHNPQETLRALRGGWLYTGDIAKRDRDGYFTIVDRKRDIIKTSGFLVFPAEVEEVLRAFPAIAEAAVVGAPDAERGEVVKAMVVPKPGGFDRKALEAHCERHLGKHKRPRQIEVVSELPKNFLGKVLRRQLREGAGQPNGNGHANGK